MSYNDQELEGSCQLGHVRSHGCLGEEEEVKEAKTSDVGGGPAGLGVDGTGGAAPDDPGLAGGYYLQPTVVRAEPDSQICQDEVFGPVVTVSTFRTEERPSPTAPSTASAAGCGPPACRGRTGSRLRCAPG